MVKSKGVRKRYLGFLQFNLQTQFKEISSEIKVSVHYDKLEINIRDEQTIEKMQKEIATIEKNQQQRKNYGFYSRVRNNC